MVTWEYKITSTADHSGNPFSGERRKSSDYLAYELNVEGSKGWELVHISILGVVYEPSEAHMIWKRRIDT